MRQEALSINSSETYRKKILVVDDYPPTRDMIVEALAAHGYVNVKGVENGTQALEILRHDPHHLVISDVIMPGMDGIDLLRHLKELRRRPAVIMVTGQPEVELTVKAMKTGAVDYLKKPFKLDDLMFRVNLYLRDESWKNNGGELAKRQEELSVHSYIFDSVETIAGNNDQIFEQVADLALKVVDGEACYLFLYDRDEGSFYPQIVRPTSEESDLRAQLSSLSKILHKAITRQEAIIATHHDHPLFSPSLICAPLMIRGNPFGVLAVRRKKHFGTFTRKDLHYVVSLTKRASLNIENKLLYESLYTNVFETFKSLVTSIHIRDQYTEEHSQRVTDLALKIAGAMAESEADCEALRIAGALHDIGKIAIPDAILLKPGRLTKEEYEIIKTHASQGEAVLTPISLFDKERKIVRYHHERWDGNGYPDGLRGEQIPLLARILAVADTYDAMTNNRPYQAARTHGEALEEIVRCKESQFDPAVVDRLLTFP